VAPTITSPLNAALTGTTQVASQVVAATGALTTTTTGIQTSNTPNAGASISSTVEDTENWNVVPVQDPDQLRRLRLLYQYGAQQIREVDLLCLYPIPEIPEKAQTNSKSDLQILADALRAASAPAGSSPAKPKDKDKDKDKDKADAADKGDKPDKKRPKIYIRDAGKIGCANAALGGRAVKYTQVGPNPDPAFLKPPGCVLCAFPNKSFADTIKTGKVYESRTADTAIKIDPDNNEYVQVIVNTFLLPHGTNYQGVIDWLFVMKDGEAPPSDEAHHVGSSGGYTVYTTSDQDFAEFVLAIQEATLQSPELQKTVAPPPAVVQTNPR
jgi:hypothetical protein